MIYLVMLLIQVKVILHVVKFSMLVWRPRNQYLKINNAEDGDPLLIRTVLRAKRKEIIFK